jgi:glycosyltransferase domain-containing protein
MNISIIIPTMNRPKLLLRLLQYLSSLEFDGHILIGDSSSAKIFREVEVDLEVLKGKLSITHCHIPGHSVAAAVVHMNKYLTTSYVCLIPDDDFIVPQTVGACIKFLDEHDDYVAAHGLGLTIGSFSGNSQIVDRVAFYRQTVSSEETASARLQRHLESYSVSLFSVHRSEVWSKMFMNVATPLSRAEFYEKSFMDELLPCCLSVVYGKVKEIDGLYLVRQMHNERYLLPSWYQWLTSEKWYASYRFFHEIVSNDICEMDGITLSRAHEAVDLGFSRYLQQVVGLVGLESLGGRIRKLVKRSIPRFGLIFLRDLRSRLELNRLSLDALMSPNSRYHREFIQIYNLVIASRGAG